MRFPLAPGGECAVSGEENEERAGGFVENLSGDAPECAEGDGGGFPEGWEEARAHEEIVVQAGPEAAGDWGVSTGYLLEMRVEACTCFVVVCVLELV
jgi:hypothetical protein